MAAKGMTIADLSKSGGWNTRQATNLALWQILGGKTNNTDWVMEKTIKKFAKGLGITMAEAMKKVAEGGLVIESGTKPNEKKGD